MKILTLSLWLLFTLVYLVHGQTTTGILNYDQADNQIKVTSGIGLKKGSYIFEVTGLNSAYHCLNFSSEFINKVYAIPATLLQQPYYTKDKIKTVFLTIMKIYQFIM